MSDSLRLNKKNKKLFKLLSGIVFTVFIAGSVYFLYRILFPSQFFTQSFENVNSLKNTITDVSQTDKFVAFFASTGEDFSEVKVDIELKKGSASINKHSLDLRKSYKSFFYPKGPALDLPVDFSENLLAASADSIFVLGKDQKNPIDNPLTFISLGYNWNNIESKEFDPGKYERKKLLNISSAHPDRTILATDKNQYYLIEGSFKRKLNQSSELRAMKYKNNIIVQENSLKTKENCQLKKRFILKRKYTCIIPIEKISGFSGKDYRFELPLISENVKIKKIDLEFKKTLSKNNLFIFLADIKNKIIARFTGQKL